LSQQTKVLRHELKFIISETDYLWLRDRLAAFMPLDSNADPATRSYHIRSLYFDDPEDTALFEKADGDDYRQKFRIRTYKSTGDIVLEKKSKVIYYTAKESAGMTKEQCQAVLAGDFQGLFPSDNTLMLEFYAKLRTRALKPKVIVDYVREAYLYPSGNVRITFDRELRSGNYSVDIFSDRTSPLPVMEPGTMVMEVKYDSFFPPHIKALIQGLSGQRLAVSKYVLCRRYH
jgi:hypothetical protein